MATFLANEINSTGGDMTGRTAHVQNRSKLCFFKGIKNAGYLKIFFWDVDELDNRRKSNSV